MNIPTLAELIDNQINFAELKSLHTAAIAKMKELTRALDSDELPRDESSFWVYDFLYPKPEDGEVFILPILEDLAGEAIEKQFLKDHSEIWSTTTPHIDSHGTSAKSSSSAEVTRYLLELISQYTEAEDQLKTSLKNFKSRLPKPEGE